MHNICHMPDENHRPTNTLLQARKSKPSVTYLLCFHAHLDANRLPDYHRYTASRQALQRLIEFIGKYITYILCVYLFFINYYYCINLIRFYCSLIKYSYKIVCDICIIIVIIIISNTLYKYKCLIALILLIIIKS